MPYTYQFLDTDGQRATLKAMILTDEQRHFALQQLLDGIANESIPDEGKAMKSQPYANQLTLLETHLSELKAKYDALPI